VAEDAADGRGRTDNVKEFIAAVSEYYDENPDTTLAEYLEEVALLTDVDGYENDPERITLMTLHAAKGLEFPHVFIVGMEEGLLPHRSSIDAGAASADTAIEEERRLAYVGITRAKKSLAFSYTLRRKRYGEVVACEPSRFLNELPADDLQWEGKGGNIDPEQKQERGAAHVAHLRNLLG